MVSMSEMAKERIKKQQAERQRYLAMSEHEAEKLSVPERYQRIRYLRELEGAEMLNNLKRKLPSAPVAAPAPKEKKPYLVGYGGPRKIVYNQD